MPSSFNPSPNNVQGDTVASGSTHQITGTLILSSSIDFNTLTLLGMDSGTLAGPGSYLGLNGDDQVILHVGAGGGGGGGGDVTGPASSTNTAIARYSGTGGTTLLNSGIAIDGSNNMTGVVAISASSYISASSFHGDSYRDPATAGQVLFTDTGGITNSDAGLMYAPGSDTLYIPNITTLGSVDLTIDTTAGQDAKLYLGDDDGNKALFFYNNSAAQVALIDAAGRISGSQIYGDGSNLTNLQAAGSAADSIQIGNNNGAVAIGSLNISFGGTVSGQGSQAIGPGSPVANQAGASAIGSGSHSTATNALAVGTTSVASAAAAVALGSSATGSAANAIAVGTTTKATAAGATALGNAATSSAAGAIAIGSGATTAGAYSIVLGDTITHVTHNHTTVIGSRADVGGVNAVAIGSGSNAGAANAIAIGEAAAPSAANTVAVGKSATSSGTGSVVIGAGASTTGQQSVALGPVNTTTANYTTVVGYNNNASVNYSIVIGDTSIGSAANAIAVGQKTKASGADAIALGQFATASAANTIAIGSGSNAARANTAVFGNSTVPMRLYVSGGFAQTNFYHGAAHVNGSQQLAAGTYNIFDVRYDGATQITASNLVAGASYLIFLSNSVGAAAVTYDPTTFKFPAGTVPTVTQTQGAIDIVSGISDGTAIYCDMTKNFS